MHLVRFGDWQARLSVAVLGGASGPAPFAYGRRDCALFAADAVLAMTGHDFAAAYRGRYTTLRGGLRILRAAGFCDHVALAEAYLTACHAALLAPGDLAVLDGPDGRVLGVVGGAVVYLLDPAGRVVVRPLTDAQWGLRV